ncbi:HAMP domain-containing histidine kinase [Streptomyces piniterrae]|uniref:histidine kinase n=1 Tax=Streptomyces piniterrae TaxID=2571125 RepID=A0A4U0MNW2_9ACTN|nr:HAMP domain-containing sensor histidine kinase [Streptomyces piniterrae]TJZ42226.1 HAMP domain-containing histidine kinase [Streptomyces piniterrae]
MRLSTRIAVAMGVAVPLLVLGSGALLLRLVTHDVHAEQDARLRERAAVLLPLARGLLRSEDGGRPRQTANQERRLLAAGLDVGVRLTTATGGRTPGRVVAEAGPRPADTVWLPPAALEPVTVRSGGHSWRALSVQVGGAGAKAARHGTLWVFSSGSAGNAEIDTVQKRFLLVALITAPLAGLVSLAIAERATLPLRRLQRRAGGLDPGTSTARLDHAPSRITEVDDLAGTLQTVLSRYDEQAARTREALATARAFAATASHELRTPLMGMQTNLDVLTDHPDLDPAERAEILDDLHSGHQRLMGLLVALRALAQGDLVEADAFGVVDLSELVAVAVADLARHHPSAQVTTQLAPGLRLHAWEPGLRMAVDNLLRNAVVHGGRPGAPARVAVALRPSGRPADPVAVLTVDDDGPGIAPEERAQVFQRFRRRPDSPGSGLGLTLVAQQIALHRGTVRITDRPDGPGTRIEVRLPRTGDAANDTRTLELPLRRDWLSELPAHGRPRNPAAG